MRFDTLDQWLAWQESLNPREIDLGLDRVQRVLAALQLSADFPCTVITVAGTNGKGSCVAMLESILRAAGYSVGCYTSPHLFRYNERIRIDAEVVDNASLCRAFERVDRARGDIALTYFEFGTLAALLLFAERKPDVVVLEVGLGGRLDAVNVVDPDVALITTVDIDHTDWLGNDIETIAREKAGIMRPHRPAIYGGLSCPRSIRQQAGDQQVELFCAGDDYIYQGVGETRWQLRGGDLYYADLPRPSLPGGFQLQNAAAVVVALSRLGHLDVDVDAIRRGLQSAHLPGRFQTLGRNPRVIVDVAHNPQAARALVELLGDHPVPGRTLAVIAMLSDKAIDEVLGIMAPVVDQWYSAGIVSSRGLDADSMAEAVNRGLPGVKLSRQSTVAGACEQALRDAEDVDRVIVFGSFLTVTEACDYLNGKGIG